MMPSGHRAVALAVFSNSSNYTVEWGPPASRRTVKAVCRLIFTASIARLECLVRSGSP